MILLFSCCRSFYKSRVVLEDREFNKVVKMSKVSNLQSKNERLWCLVDSSYWIIDLLLYLFILKRNSEFTHLRIKYATFKSPKLLFKHFFKTNHCTRSNIFYLER
jgi:hypothetical protein